jgi:hypothetical protein
MPRKRRSRNRPYKKVRRSASAAGPEASPSNRENIMDQFDWLSWLKENAVLVSACGWNGYLRHGRGAVVLDSQPEKLTLGFVPLERLQDEESSGLPELIRNYDPLVEIVYCARTIGLMGNAGTLQGVAECHVPPPDAYKQVTGYCKN